MTLPTIDPFRTLTIYPNYLKSFYWSEYRIMSNHVTSSPNFNPNQSAYRPYHSTETALIFTLDNILHSADQGSSSVLVSLDLSAAFDTIDHNILLSRLDNSFGIHGLGLSWFQSYLSDRSQFVRIGHCKSTTSICISGVHKVLSWDLCFFSLYFSYRTYSLLFWPHTATIR